MVDPTPINITELLVVCLAVIAALMLLRKKYDSNLPLLFYVVAVIFARACERPVNPLIMYGGLAFCLLLRFEFMGGVFAKLISFCALGGLVLMIFSMVSDVLA